MTIELSENTYSFWDLAVEDGIKDQNAEALDSILQIRGEAEKMLAWVRKQKIASYLEIGIWTGRFLNYLQKEAGIPRVVACDLEHAQSFGLRCDISDEIPFFRGNCFSPIFIRWIGAYAPFDLVFLDAERTYEAVERNFRIHSQLGAKHIAIAGIAPQVRGEQGARDFWKKLRGNKIQIIEPHLEIDAQESSIGIGIWSAE